jgi:predicted kinase
MQEPSQKVYILVGLPASGKSTYAKWLSQGSNSEILDGDTLKTSKKVEQELKYKLNEGKNVIVDACNVSLQRRTPLIKQCKQRNIHVYAIYFKIPLEICKERAKKRELETGKHISTIAYNKLNKDFIEPTLEEGFDGILYIDQ